MSGRNRPLPPLPSRPPNRPPPPPPLNTYTQLLKDRPLDLFRRYSVSPPDGAVGEEQTVFNPMMGMNQTKNPQLAPWSNTSDIHLDGMLSRFFNPGTTGQGFKAASTDRKIAWVQLDAHPLMHGALTFKAVIPSSPDKIPPCHIPVWFLPWNSHHLIDLSIPASQGMEDDDPDDPKLFFTAAINGCSVFVRGDPRSPTVYHAGISQGQTPYGNNPSDFWRDLLSASLASSPVQTGKTWEINNKDYINQTGVSGGAQTRNATVYENWLKSLPKGEFTISHVIPWGCVFGIRYGSLWSFYLQENATVHRYKIVASYETVQGVTTKTSMFGLRSRQVTEDVSVRRLVKKENTINRPIVVRDFFPGKGEGHKNFIDVWQRA